MEKEIARLEQFLEELYESTDDDALIWKSIFKVLSTLKDLNNS